MLETGHRASTNRTGTEATAPQIAVLLPCYNEAVTIGKVVRDFRTVLPQATVYVFDNNSTDQTAAKAQEAGATVVPSKRQGKGNVVRHMFDTIDADYYIMADGDDTYPAAEAPKLLDVLRNSNADMVVGARMEQNREKSFRRFHRFGNHIITLLIRKLFSAGVTDVLSGYRVFSREFVKTIPLTSEGFAIETELTLQAVAKRFLIREVPIHYGERPEGSHSKLSTWADGWIILRAIVLIMRDFKPLLFFTLVSLAFLIASLASGYVPIVEYFETGLVPHFPRAVLASALAILSAFSFGMGVILETVHRYHTENHLLWRRYFKQR